MSEDQKGFFNHLFSGIDFIRRAVLNIVFFVVLIIVLALLFGKAVPDVPGSTVLVINPKGTIVEELSPGGVQAGFEQMLGMSGRETLLKDLIDAIDTGRTDNRVKVLLLDLNRLGGVGLTKLQDLKEALLRFKKSGKKVIATADDYSRNAYYLAAHADEIYLHHMGLITLDGYSRYRQFYKGFIDKLEIDVNIFRVGKYKSAVEPLLRNDMSEAAKEANLRWLGVLWDIFLKDVSEARKIPVDKLKEFNSRYVERIGEFKGDVAQLVKAAGLVDYLVTRDELRDRLIKIVGEDEDTHTFYKVTFADYLEALDRDRWGEDESGDVVAVIVAKGNILNGSQPPGAIGGDSTAKLIREARKDEDVKAIVLRVDSGGGSAFASEVIRRELELARKDGIPVISSMGSVAASGGYWITMASDEVWAYPSTITGSIGIFGMFPTYQKPLAKHLGIHVDGVGTNKLAGGLRFDRALDPEFGKAIQLIIEKGYDDFITGAAKARNKTPEEIHEVAQGRVWSGADARRLGLVDHLGGFDDALKAAAKRAKLGDDFKVKYFRQKKSFKEQLMEDLFGEVRQAVSPTPANSIAAPFGDLMRLMARQVFFISRFNDPHGVYAYCPYTVE